MKLFTQINSRMADIDDDDNEDQGFILNKLQIKEKDQPRPTQFSTVRPTDFQARYICGDKILKKQPIQIHQAGASFANDLSIQLQNSVFKKKTKQPLLHPYQKYFSSPDYALCYHRSHKDKSYLSTANDNYSKNEVNLTSMAQYKDTNYSLLKPEDNLATKCQGADLEFDSKFECGNLLMAFKNLQQEHTYDLFMQTDTNTNGYNRWFYFSVKNAKKGIKYKFNIVNFRKKFAFFNEGLKPVIFSLNQDIKNDLGWTQRVSNVKFQKSYLNDCKNPLLNAYFTLSFQISFSEDNDLHLIATGLPYSYTHLMNKLHQIQQIAQKNPQIHWQIQSIAHTLSNNQVPYLTITSKQSNKDKKVILILARQHPGETWSSFYMESILRQLTCVNNQNSEWLLQNYVFKVFPMINVDGVIYGNARCDLSGMDLNRNWKNPSKQLHPQIYSIKEEIIKISSQNVIQCCIDLHGHSKDYNVFCYSCKTDNHTCRVLPYIISQNSDSFSFQNCTFGISKCKESTARAIIYSIIKNVNVLTIESSYFGTNKEGKKEIFEPKSFDTIAQSLLLSLRQYFNRDNARIVAENAIHKRIGQFLEYTKRKGVESGSDSDPECDQISLKEKLGSIIPKFVANTFAEDLEQKTETKKNPHKKKKKKHINDQSLSITNKNTLQVNQKQKKDDNKIPSINNHQNNQSKKIFIDRNTFFNSKVTSKPKNTQQILNQTLKPMQNDDKGRKSSISNKQYMKKYKIEIESLHQSSQKVSVELQNKLQSIKASLAPKEPLTNREEKTATKYELQFKYGVKQQQELPLLCVLSDKKKKAHYQRLKMLKVQKQVKKEVIFESVELPRYEPTLIISKKLDTLAKLKEKQRNSNYLLSAIWKQNMIQEKEKANWSIFMDRR